MDKLYKLWVWARILAGPIIMMLIITLFLVVVCLPSKAGPTEPPVIKEEWRACVLTLEDKPFGNYLCRLVESNGIKYVGFYTPEEKRLDLVLKKNGDGTLEILYESPELIQKRTEIST